MTEITNSSTTSSPEEIAEAGRHYGIEFETTVIKQGFATEAEAEAAKAEADAAETKPKDSSRPGESEKPAEVVAAEADAKSKTEAEGKPADEQADLSDKAKKALKDKNKQIDRLTGRAKTAEQELAAERAKREDLERQLATGKKEPVAAATPEPEPDTAKRPARPPRPKLEQFEYDQARFDLAMDKYETETIPAYEDKLSEWTRATTVREIREAQALEIEQRAIEEESIHWNQVVDSREGLREKLAAATDVMVSPAMNAVMRTMMSAEDRAIILEHFADNPEDAARIMDETYSPQKKGNKANGDDWAVDSARASWLLADLRSKLTGSAGPVLVPKAEKPKVTPVRESVPPAKPKPPVSAAPEPIEPVGARTSASGPNIEDPNIDTSSYLEQREQARINRMRTSMAR